MDIALKNLLAFSFCVALIVISPLSLPAKTAQVQLSNNSIRIYPGDCSCGFGLTWTIYFSTFLTEDPVLANGEVAPLPQPTPYTYWSYLILEDPSLYASATYAELDLPMAADGNNNGTSDFLEVGQAISSVSAGTYAVSWNPGYGLLELTWTRAAGTRQGTCVLYMVDPILGRMGPFTHTFELIEYSGQLSYSPGSNTVTGTINLTRSGQPSDVLQGPATLLKAPTNRFNLLTLPAGGWTNQAETFEFDACELKRDAARPAIYRGVLHNPSSTFRSWTLSITDTNDANGNGIPDLSDDPGVVSPSRPPVLSLSRNSTHLLLQISGVVGRTNVIERALSPVSANWEIVQSITLTNDPQTVLLPLPSEAAMFWRVRVQ